MIRDLWRLLVPGYGFTILIWIGFAVYHGAISHRTPILILDIVLALLNLWSWDYQRRHRT